MESSVIDSYSVNLNYAKLGIQTFAIAISKLTSAGLDLGELEVEQNLLKNPNIISVYRLPKGNSTHVLLYGFKDMNELDSFFHSPEVKKDIHSYLEAHELFTFSHNSLIKQSPSQLFHKVIDSAENKVWRIKFDELEKFKKRL